jgi:hypothetical protein
MEGTWRKAIGFHAAKRWPLRYFAAISGLLAFSLGLFLVARRASGALSSSPRSEVVALTALTLVLWAWLVRMAYRQSGQAHQQSLAGELRSPDSAFTIWIPLIVTSLFAVACSYPFARVVDYVVWSVALAAVIWGPQFALPARRSSPAIGGEICAGSVLQELTRYRLADGREAVRGTLRADFAAGERSTTLYVAFCPPFERLPHVEAFVVDGPPATVKLAQVLHQGAQIEVRLAGMASCQQSVTVRLSAVERPVTETANSVEASAAR